MRKTWPRKLLSYLLTLAMAVSLLPMAALQAGAADYSVMPAVTEKFTTEIDGGMTFTESGLTFNITGGSLHVEQNAGWGFDDDFYVDNSDHPLPGAGIAGSFKCTTSDFTVHSLKLITLNASVSIEQYNNILICGKLGGSTVFTHTVPYDSINTTSADNYYTIVDLSSHSSEVIDELFFEVESYGTNDIKYLMIDDFSFSQAVANTAPTVATEAATDVTGTTATGNGNITSLGSPNPTQHGFVWSTSADPTVALETKTTQGAASVTGAFTGSITGLTAGTTYHVRAYATNTEGTSYGDDVTFTTAAAAAPADTWDGAVAEGFAGGDGSSGNPYKIATAEQLAYMANRVNNVTENANYGNKYYILTADLDLDSRQWTPIGEMGSELEPKAFSGSFNGGGHVVSNLAIGTAGTPNAVFADAGLFGYVNKGAVTGVYVLNAAVYSAGGNVGALVGYWNGSGGVATPVTNCGTTGTISGSGENSNVGGLIGKADYCAVSNCFSTCGVTGGTSASVGGLIGYLVSIGSVTSCFATGDVTSTGSNSCAGGLIGISARPTANCYAAGSASAVYGGGLVGYVDMGATIVGYYNSTANTKGIGAGTDSATPKTSAYMKESGFVSLLNYGYTGVWETVAGANQGYPVLVAVPMEVIVAAPAVTTGAVSDVAQTTATGHGNITSLGSPAPTAYGVCWNTAGNPTVSDSVKDLGAASATGVFTAAITGLTAGTTYHVRAYATNTENTSYGDDVTFTTPAAAAASLTGVTWVGASTYTCGITMSSSSKMATISVDTGYFTVPSLGSAGLTFLYGTNGTSQIGSYGSSTPYSSAVFSFTNVADAENLLGDIIYAANGAAQQKITVTVSTVSPIAGDIYFEGHFYRYVSASVNWVSAVLAAHGTADPYFGGKGYAATATSQAENSILLKLVDNNGGGSDHWNDAWMGGLWQRNSGTVASPSIFRGTDGSEITYADLLGATALQRQNMLVRYTNIYTDFNSSNTSTYIYANPGTVKYYWIDGPEAGQEIANNTADFAPWHSGEPNSGDFVYIGWEGAYWDDYSSDSGALSGYIVEFSGFDGGSTEGIVANDIKTMTMNTAPTDISLDTASVPENTAVNTTVGALSTTDSDVGDTFTYTLASGTGDTDNASFTIDGTSLKLGVSPDYETKSSYALRIETKDAAGAAFSKAFTVTVTDVSEAPAVTAVGKTSGFTQGDAVGADLFETVTADVVDGGQTFAGATLLVTGIADSAEYLTVSGTDILLANGSSGTFTGGSYSVSVLGVTATVTLTDMALDNAAMASLIDSISYKSEGKASVTEGIRTVTLAQVSDSGTSGNTAMLSIIATVTVARLASAQESTVTALPAEILADGTATSTVTVTLKDANGSPVAGKTVTLAQGTGSSAIDPASAVTGADGIAKFTVKGLTLETVTYTATDSTDSVTVSETASVTFTVPTYAVTVRTKLDGTATDMTSVALKSGSTALAASKTAAGIYTVTVANGTYKVYVNGIYTGSDVTVHYAPEDTVISFYTVTFNSIGGSAVGAQTVIEGSKAAIPAVPSKPGSSFDGWYGDAGYGSVWNFSTGTVTEPKTLFAKWSAVPTYTVTYEDGGATSGSVPTDTTAYETGAFVTVKSNVGSLAKTENTFAGWTDGVASYAPGAHIVIADNVTLTALWTPVVRTYTVTYTNNFEGGGTYATESGVVYGARLTPPAAPARESYSFIGWYKDFACASAWNFATDTVTANTTLYAKWSGNTYSVTGTVMDDGTPAHPVSGAAISLVQGNMLFGETATDADGSFTLTGIPDGIYNLVATKGSQKVTICVEISGEDKPMGTVTLPSGNKNSVLEVGGSGTPDVVVDNLQDVFEDEDVFTPEDEENVADEGATVEIRLTVQKNDASADKTAVQVTMSAGGYTTGMILDVDMTKTVTSSSGALVGASQVKAVDGLIKLIIPLPRELQGKSSYVVTRAHDYEDGRGVVVDTITTTPDPDDNERLVVSEDKTQLTLYVKYFSTYAIGFTAPSDGSSSTSSGYIITASAGAGGGIAPAGKTSVARGGSKTFAITPNTGYCVSDVLVDGVSVGALTSYIFSDVRKAHTIEATFVKNEGLPYYVGEDGNAVFIGFAAKKDGVMKYIAPAGVTVLFKENPKHFEDTFAHWAKSYIAFVTEREIFMGADDSIFAPNEGMTRAMFATVIGRLYERSYGEIKAFDVQSFSDCNYGVYYAKYVEWAAKEGILEGYGDGRFGPNDAVTREQMAAILYRFADYLGMLPEELDTALGYADKDVISTWATDAAMYCQGAKIITGRDGGTFVPQGLATRAEVAVILERFIENVVD